MHGLFPAVLWVAPTPARAAAILRSASKTSREPKLFRACTPIEYLAVLTGGAASK
jgi:hypothetical protein